MKFIGQIFEQIVEAGKQIDRNTPTSARIALILTDNVFEILMYKLALEEFKEDDWLINIKKPKFKKNYRERVLEHFKDKTNFIKNQIGIYSDDQAYIINECHKFRNESYHLNIIRDLIIIQLSKKYFELCCKMFPKLWIGDFTYSYKENPPDIFRELGLDIEWSLSEKELNKITKSFCKNRKCSNNEFFCSLSSDLIERLKELNDKIDFLESALSYLPTDVLTFTQLVEEYEDFIPESEINDVLSSFKPKVTKNNLVSWSEIALNIKLEKKISRGIQRYKNIDRQLIYIEKIIGEASIQVDQQIELEVDREIEERSFRKIENV